jgi:hypothetical protein
LLHDIRAFLNGFTVAQSQAEQLDTIAKRLYEIERILIEAVNSAQESKLLHNEKIERIERKLDMIAAAVCVRETERSETDAEDSKRLKERLKECTQGRLKKMEDVKESWIEYIFGICKPDGRVGKEGSRQITILPFIGAPPRF